MSSEEDCDNAGIMVCRLLKNKNKKEQDQNPLVALPHPWCNNTRQSFQFEVGSLGEARRPCAKWSESPSVEMLLFWGSCLYLSPSNQSGGMCMRQAIW